MSDENAVVTDGSAELSFDSEELINALDAEDNSDSDETDSDTDSSDNNTTGQQSDSPPDKKGQQSDSPTGEQEDGGKKPQEGEKKPQEGEKKPLPFDQHPKWKAARAAEKWIDDLLDEHGYADRDELVDDLKSGKDIRDVLGDADVNTLMEKANTLDYYEKVWAQQDRENETPEERIERLEKEKEELRQDKEQVETTREEQEQAQKNIDEYTNTVSQTVDATEDMSENEKSLTRLLFGLENPAIDVDITDKGEVRKMTKSFMTQVQDLVGKIRQDTIDNYAAGKLKMNQTGKPPATEPVVQEKKSFRVKDDAVVNDTNVEDFFMQGAGELRELLLKQFEEQT